MNGVIKIEYAIVGGQLQIGLTAPLQDQAQRDLTCKILASAISIAINYQPSPLIKPTLNGHPHTGPAAPPLIKP